MRSNIIMIKKRNTARTHKRSQIHECSRESELGALALGRVRAIRFNTQCVYVLDFCYVFFCVYAEPRITFHFSHMYQRVFDLFEKNSVVFTLFSPSMVVQMKRRNFNGKRTSFRATMCAHTIAAVVGYKIFIVLMICVRMRMRM